MSSAAKKLTSIEVKGGPRRRTNGGTPQAFFERWQSVEVVPANASNDAYRDAYERARKRFPAGAYSIQTRERNPAPHHHVPAVTVKLGTVLDLVTELDPTRTEWDGELKGWQLLTDADAMRRGPGAACLYLVRGEPIAGDALPPPTSTGRDTYKSWHRREAKDDVKWVNDVPDLIGSYIGIALRIGYRSDKWSKPGEHVDYEHDFCEDGHEPPEVWADTPDLERARALVIVGGDMRVTPEGID